MNLYNQILMEHYHNPKNYKKIEQPDYEAMVLNQLCGDKIYLGIKIDDSVISDIGFQGEGCIISLATASILFDFIKNKKIETLDLLNEKDILDIIKLELGPNRLKCALLSLEALKIIGEDYKLKTGQIKC